MSSIYELREPILQELGSYRKQQRKDAVTLTTLISRMRFRGPRKRSAFYAAIRELYALASKELSIKHPLTLVRTHSERKVLQTICRYSKVHFMPSHWIGRYNCDLYSPSIGGIVTTGEPRARGLVVEVDGGIHVDELKMRKDESKYSFLQSMGIMVMSLNNKDLKTGRALRVLKHIRNLPRLDSRSRARLNFKVHIETIVASPNTDHLNLLFATAAQFGGVTNE